MAKLAYYEDYSQRGKIRIQGSHKTQVCGAIGTNIRYLGTPFKNRTLKSLILMCRNRKGSTV
jgi:hypothetical protein